MLFHGDITCCTCITLCVPCVARACFARTALCKLERDLTECNFSFSRPLGGCIIVAQSHAYQRQLLIAKRGKKKLELVNLDGVLERQG